MPIFENNTIGTRDMTFILSNINGLYELSDTDDSRLRNTLNMETNEQITLETID